jgi:hypothetical protein
MGNLNETMCMNALENQIKSKGLPTIDLEEHTIEYLKDRIDE